MTTLYRDVQSIIASNLSYKDIISLCRVNRETYSQCQDPLFWQYLIKEKYPQAVTLPLYQTNPQKLFYYIDGNLSYQITISNSNGWAYKGTSNSYDFLLGSLFALFLITKRFITKAKLPPADYTINVFDNLANKEISIFTLISDMYQHIPNYQYSNAIQLTKEGYFKENTLYDIYLTGDYQNGVPVFIGQNVENISTEFMAGVKAFFKAFPGSIVPNLAVFRPEQGYDFFDVSS